MASCKNYEALWNKYQQEGVPKQISISRFCENHGVKYRHFEHWYKTYFKQRAYKVEIVNAPDSSVEAPPSKEVKSSRREIKSENFAEMKILKADIVLENGLEYHRENLNYSKLKHIIKNMEVLCSR